MRLKLVDNSLLKVKALYEGFSYYIFRFRSLILRVELDTGYTFSFAIQVTETLNLLNLIGEISSLLPI